MAATAIEVSTRVMAMTLARILRGAARWLSSEPPREAAETGGDPSHTAHIGSHGGGRAARPTTASELRSTHVSSPGPTPGLLTRREGAVASPSRRARFDPTPGLLVADKYRIDSVIGEGGMGVVVAATHVGLDQRVAIKFLLPEARRNAEAVERFLREARVAARVNSDHVARVSDVGTMNDGTPFLVMEHLDGADLDALLKGGPLAVEEACEIALQACEALAEVHAAGIVHRDLKPSNLFVTRRADGAPCVKLLDFGISKLTDASDGADPALTATAAIMGSPSYMSPEQLRSTKEVDARTDVWSLGAVLYEAVTGQGAFRRETVPQVFAMIASEDPTAPSQLQKALPEPLDHAILGCLAKNPDERSTLVDLARALVLFAPPRAQVSLERVEAMLGAERSVPALPARLRSPSATGPSLTATSGSADSHAAGRGHARARPRWKTLLVLGALVGLVALVATGRIDLARLRGRVAAAASAIPAAPSIPPFASAVASAVAPIASAVAPMASALEDDPEESGDPSAPSTAAAAAGTANPGSRSPQRWQPGKHLAPRPKPGSGGAGKVRHRRHY